MKKKLNQKGFSAIEAVIIFVVVALLVGVGWYVFNKKKNDDKKKEAPQSQPVKDEPKISDEDEVKQAASDYCKEIGVKFWKDTYKLDVTPSTISAVFDTPGGKFFSLKSNHAGLNMSCISTAASQDQVMTGFKAYFEKINNKWIFYHGAQQAVLCEKFDGKGWPVEVVPTCEVDDGSGNFSSRPPR